LCTNRSIVTFDVVTGNQVASFPTLNPPTDKWNRAVELFLSPDGSKLAVTSPSTLGVDLWEAKTGRLLYSLPDQSGTVFCMAWSPDSRRLAVSRSNGDINIWNLPEIERVLAELGLGLGER
jgi:WD40 repeat protein